MGAMKFANGCRLIKRDALLDDGWHPLDSVPPPDYVPSSRDGPHVGKRLVGGLRTLMLMPRVRGPQAFGNGWPEYAHDWADLLAQQELQREVVGQVVGEFSDDGCDASSGPRWSAALPS
jgi:hypothetical protein